jgi:dihydrofolate reductase
MRKVIAAFRMSLDGFVEGPNGDNGWVDTWEDTFDLMPQIDEVVLGGGMYPGYEQYWSAVHADPQGALPFTGKPRPRVRPRTRASRTPLLTSSCPRSATPCRGRRLALFATSRRSGR